MCPDGNDKKLYESPMHSSTYSEPCVRMSLLASAEHENATTKLPFSYVMEAQKQVTFLYKVEHEQNLEYN